MSSLFVSGHRTLGSQKIRPVRLAVSGEKPIVLRCRSIESQKNEKCRLYHNVSGGEWSSGEVVGHSLHHIHIYGIGFNRAKIDMKSVLGFYGEMALWTIPNSFALLYSYQDQGCPRFDS